MCVCVRVVHVAAEGQCYLRAVALNDLLHARSQLCSLEISGSLCYVSSACLTHSSHTHTSFQTSARHVTFTSQSHYLDTCPMFLLKLNTALLMNPALWLVRRCWGNSSGSDWNSDHRKLSRFFSNSLNSIAQYFLWGVMYYCWHKLSPKAKRCLFSIFLEGVSRANQSLANVWIFGCCYTGMILLYCFTQSEESAIYPILHPQCPWLASATTIDSWDRGYDVPPTQTECMKGFVFTANSAENLKIVSKSMLLACGNIWAALRLGLVWLHLIKSD